MIGSRIAIGLTLIGGLAHLRGLCSYRGLPSLSEPAGEIVATDELPMVSIIVPARNEAHNLPGLLQNLLDLDYPRYEVIVVDDQSIDETAAVARRIGAATEARPDLRWSILTSSLPIGWTGKAAACHAGAEIAVGEWLLFTDADTRHASKALSAAMGTALGSGASVLSVMPEQRCLTLWERLVVPFLYASYFAGVDLRNINRSPSTALINGQYILIHRDTYRAVGGHRAVAASLVEDVAFGVALLTAGFRVVLCRADGLVQVRMYHDWRSLEEGFRKNSMRFLVTQPERGIRVGAATVCASMGAAGLIATICGSRNERVGGAIALGIAAASFAGWARACGASPLFGLLQPMAGISALIIVARAALAFVLRRPVTWKGRSYEAEGR